jgi:hypothetical protein
MLDQPKPVVWVGSSRTDLKAFPKRVRSDIGQALYAAQMGETDPAAKPLKLEKRLEKRGREPFYVWVSADPTTFLGRPRG